MSKDEKEVIIGEGCTTLDYLYHNHPWLKLLIKGLEENNDKLLKQYQKFVAVALECAPILAYDREDDNLEPPWEVFARVKKERDEARSWVKDLQSGMYINCVYCGYRYGPNPEVPDSMADVLKRHVEKCPKHPMSTIKKQLETMRVRDNEALLKALGKLIKHEPLESWLDTINESFEGVTPRCIINGGNTEQLWAMVHRLNSGIPG